MYEPAHMFAAPGAVPTFVGSCMPVIALRISALGTVSANVGGVPVSAKRCPAPVIAHANFGGVSVSAKKCPAPGTVPANFGGVPVRAFQISTLGIVPTFDGRLLLFAVAFKTEVVSVGTNNHV